MWALDTTQVQVLHLPPAGHMTSGVSPKVPTLYCPHLWRGKPTWQECQEDLRYECMDGAWSKCSAVVASRNILLLLPLQSSLSEHQGFTIWGLEVHLPSDYQQICVSFWVEDLEHPPNV